MGSQRVADKSLREETMPRSHFEADTMSQRAMREPPRHAYANRYGEFKTKLPIHAAHSTPGSTECAVFLFPHTRMFHGRGAAGWRLLAPRCEIQFYAVKDGRRGFFRRFTLESRQLLLFLYAQATKMLFSNKGNISCCEREPSHLSVCVIRESAVILNVPRMDIRRAG